MDIKLTQTVSCGGCASKVNPIDLYSILEKLPINQTDNLIVGYETGDDACVYLQNEENALIFTTDFIAPIVDDPYDFGRIAATNALSDIYAMGGNPLLALNIACFNQKLGNEVLEQILLGSASVCKDSNAILCGGHTVRANEIRYGLAVIGNVNPKNIITNSNGKAGDILYLTKPLGIGVLSQALKKGLLNQTESDGLISLMCQLNNKVAEVMLKVGVKCATDVTGFGLLGHILKLLQSSKCSAEISLEKVPVLSNALEFLEQGIYSKNLIKNQEYVQPYLSSNLEITPLTKLLFDPQTSGGMLICVDKMNKVKFENQMKQANLTFAEIGNLIESNQSNIYIK